MRKRIQVLMIAVSLFMSACVTTTTSPYDDKKDLKKAEQSYIQIGYGYFERNNLLEAKKALTTALDINSKSAGAHMGLARVYEKELEYDLADSHFQRSLKHGGTEAHFQYAVYLYNRGDYKASYRSFSKVLKDTIYLRRPQAFEYQGIVASRLGKMDEAIEYYRRAVALAVNLPNSHLGLARIYFSQNDATTAYSHYKGFVRLVHAKQVRNTASTLWLGIQLANLNEDSNAVASMSLQLKQQFKDSAEYQQYLKWQAE